MLARFKLFQATPDMLVAKQLTDVLTTSNGLSIIQVKTNYIRANTHPVIPGQ